MITIVINILNNEKHLLLVLQVLEVLQSTCPVMIKSKGRGIKEYRLLLRVFNNEIRCPIYQLSQVNKSHISLR